MTMVTPRRRLRPEERRREILEAASELVSERGFRGVSIQDIADRAGLGKAGVRHHFPSKNDVLLALLIDRDAHLQQLIETSSSFSGTHPGRGVVDAVVRRNAGHREIVQLFAVLQAEALDPEHPAHDYFRRRLAEALRLFRDATATLPDPDLSALQLVAFLSGLEVLWLQDATVPYQQVWEHFADQMFGPRAAGLEQQTRSTREAS
jgi:AcrR family transcriptional regulator